MTNEGSGGGPVNGAVVRAWFSDPVAVAHYARAADTLGLWRSEQRLFAQVFQRGQKLLDVGCGAGRVTLGLARLGYTDVSGVDFCEPLLAEARRLGAAAAAGIDFRFGDASALPYPGNHFGGAIFAFNGLMQIPGRENRRCALREIRRVVAAGARFVFTTHDRNLDTERAWWQRERERWDRGERRDGVREFGDRILHNPEGRIFMHLPDRAEILDDLLATGWRHGGDWLRRDLANESAVVREFADECRFWLAHAP